MFFKNSPLAIFFSQMKQALVRSGINRFVFWNDGFFKNIFNNKSLKFVKRISLIVYHLNTISSIRPKKHKLCDRSVKRSHACWIFTNESYTLHITQTQVTNPKNIKMFFTFVYIASNEYLFPNSFFEHNFRFNDITDLTKTLKVV